MRATQPRSGLSLIEVLLALGIFVLAFIAISSLISRASDISEEIEYETDAARLAESKLAEVVAGVEPLTSQVDIPFDEEPEWTWSMDAEMDPYILNLWHVTVTVSRPRRGGDLYEVAISQMIVDPTMRGQLAPSPEDEMLDEEPVE